MASFDKQMLGIQNKVAKRLGNVFKDVGGEVYTEAVLASPVDTGRFRGSWRISKNRISPSVNRPLKVRGKERAKTLQGPETRRLSTFQNLRSSQSITKDATLYISNNLHYARDLNRGKSRRQAPSGIIKPVSMVLRANLPSVINRALHKNV